MAEPSKSPFVSVIIVNYNGIEFVESCIESVLATDYPSFEVVFVDNASSDGSLEKVRSKYGLRQDIHIIANVTGLGPAKGRNKGIENSTGEYLVFLDNDTVVTPEWLKNLISVFEKNEIVGCAQSKILLSDRKTIDTCGHYLSFIGFPYEIGTGETDISQYNALMEILGARSAAMCVRRLALKNAGVFDPDYFMHSEETDLSWRIWLTGYSVVYVPNSVVYHKRGSSINPASRVMQFYEGAKNCPKTLIKNAGLLRLTVLLPLHILTWLLLATVFMLKRRFSDSAAIFRGLWWNISHGKKILKDRYHVQSMRVISDKTLFPIITGRITLWEFIKKSFRWLSKA